ALARDRAHARGHFLNDNQRNRGGNQRPKQCVPILRAGLRVSENAARIVVDIRRDEPWTDHREQSEQAITKYRPGFYRMTGARVLWYGMAMLGWLHRHTYLADLRRAHC